MKISLTRPFELLKHEYWDEGFLIAIRYKFGWLTIDFGEIKRIFT